MNFHSQQVMLARLGPDLTSWCACRSRHVRSGCEYVPWGHDTHGVANALRDVGNHVLTAYLRLRENGTSLLHTRSSHYSPTHSLTQA
jgi:hypothetical protein